MSSVSIDSLWRVLNKRYDLTSGQDAQLRVYASELQNWNESINLTGLTSLHEILELHFDDSLTLSSHIDLTKIKSLADIGAGAGFPGIPLKIKYPHLSLYLIEVNHKKILFLEHIIKILGLSDVHVCALDWRTFLRTTQLPIDLFCSRAAIDPTELVRMFKPSCFYNAQQLVYWAADTWQAPKHIAQFVTQEYVYHIAGRKRRLILFKKGPSVVGVDRDKSNTEA